MLRLKVWFMVAAAVLAIFAVPAARADVFHLNVDYCSNPCLSGSPGGTVTLTDQGSGKVQVDVALTGGLDFHQTNGLDAFAFQVSGLPTLTINSITSDFSLNGQTTGSVGAVVGGTQEDGAGTFGYIIKYHCQPCVDGSTLSFNVSATGLTPASFETTGPFSNSNNKSGHPINWSSNNDFAANVSAGGACTGVIGGGVGTTDSTTVVTQNPGGTSCAGVVPEPASIGSFGAGLLAVAFVLRRTFARR